MLTTADTDHDGISDGAEFEYWRDYLYNLWGGWNKEGILPYL